MSEMKIINLTSKNMADYGVCGYKDVKKHLELRNKIDWYKKYYPKGLRIKIVLSDIGGYQGMIEYVPGEYAHRPVDVAGYIFIHCVFVGFKKEFKGKGFASTLIDECIKEAEDKKMLGVAIVTRKGSFMVDKPLFLKKGFHIADKAKPDFELLVKKFDETSKDPEFKLGDPKDYGEGLTIIRSYQCPYTEKNVKSILETAKTKFHLKTKLIDVNDPVSTQASPSPFGTFCMIYNGEIVSYHPISNKRFENIMNKVLGL